MSFSIVVFPQKKTQIGLLKLCLTLKFWNIPPKLKPHARCTFYTKLFAFCPILYTVCQIRLTDYTRRRMSYTNRFLQKTVCSLFSRFQYVRSPLHSDLLHFFPIILVFDTKWSKSIQVRPYAIHWSLLR